MLGSVRLVMTWLHTWFGLLFGLVLMVVFFFGSLAIFDREIDRWAVPETRFEALGAPSFDHVLRPVLEGLTPKQEDLDEARRRAGSTGALAVTPEYYSTWWDERDPTVGFYGEFSVRHSKEPDHHVYAEVAMDPRTRTLFRHERLAIGSELFYPLHYSLTLHFMDLGIWVVGAAALLMLVALVSGLWIHKKIFQEFFTFRPRKLGQRRVLDLHNLTGVVGLPFHSLFAFTGLLIFAGIYLPLSKTTLEGLHDKHESREERANGRPQKRSGISAPLAPVDPMVAEAKRRWAARGAPADVSWISLHHVGDKNGYVAIHPSRGAWIQVEEREVFFSAATGSYLGEEQGTGISRINGFLVGLHLMPFRHWPLRWLFLIGGLVSTACIATGLLFFAGKRRQRHAEQGGSGARWVDALAVTAVTGMLIATAAVLAASRLLPGSPSGRGTWELAVFWGSWLAAFAHAALRTRQAAEGRLTPAWVEQCYALAALSVAAAALNWVTTGDHLLRTIGRGYWPVAGVDLTLLATAAMATFAAARLRSAAG